jgi:predicted RNase H-like HicB family nuclease
VSPEFAHLKFVTATNFPIASPEFALAFSREKSARRRTSSLFEMVLIRRYNLEELTMKRKVPMKLKVIIHKAGEGGYWAEVPSIAGCATQGETIEELLKNVREAVEACLSVDLTTVRLKKDDQVMEIAI